MTSDADTPDFPALVELAQRLEGKDRKTCELALYTLKKQDERLAKKDEIINGLTEDCQHHRVIKEAAINRGHEQSARIAELEAFRRDALKEVAELAKERDRMKKALAPFASLSAAKVDLSQCIHIRVMPDWIQESIDILEGK